MPIIKQSAIAYRHVKLVPDLPSGPSQYERLGTLPSGFDPLDNLKRELSEIEVTIADLKEQAVFPGVAQKYANSSSGFITTAIVALSRLIWNGRKKKAFSYGRAKAKASFCIRSFRYELPAARGTFQHRSFDIIILPRPSL